MKLSKRKFKSIQLTSIIHHVLANYTIKSNYPLTFKEHMAIVVKLCKYFKDKTNETL